MKKWMWLLLFLLGLDVVTKIAAIEWIPSLGPGPYPFGGIPIFSLGGITFSLNYITNTGAAWGVFSGYSGLLFSVRSAIIFALIYFSPKRFPIWLVITGAVGNCIDYLFYGHVVDFFHFTFWGYEFPIFNVADSCISLGVLALFLLPSKTKEVETI